MSDTIPTMKVLPWGAGQGDFVEINASDFDAETMTAFDDAAPADPTEGLTKPEIIADLIAMDIEHNPRDAKADLLALRNAGRAARDADQPEAAAE